MVDVYLRELCERVYARQVGEKQGVCYSSSSILHQQAHKHTSTSTQAQVQLNIMAPTAVSLVVKALVWWQHLHSWLIDPQVQVSPIGGGRQELCSRSSPEEDCTKAVGILSGALHLPIIWS